MYECIDIYLTRIHHVVPLLNATVLQEQTAQVDDSRISLQLVLAFCAYVASFCNNDESKESGIQRSTSGMNHLDVALAFQDLDRLTQPSPHSIYISFFLYGAFAGQGDYRQAWFYLREATTLYIMVKAEDAPWYDEQAQAFLFWIMVVSER